jgi:uncharacterized protein (TIGR02118 family)
MIRVIGLYRWEDGARFDHEYYRSEHMRLTREVLTSHGLIRLESDRYLSPKAPVPGQIIAATNAYFPTLETAQSAMAAAAKALTEDVPKYTNLKPQLHLAEVNSHV